MAKWKYKNETDKTVYWHGVVWAPNEELESTNFVPAELGLTCTTEGEFIDPVLHHEDINLTADCKRTVELPLPKRSNKVHLSLFALSGAGTFSFLSAANKQLPLDTRGFEGVMDWSDCAKIFITCITDAKISVSAVEAC